MNRQLSLSALLISLSLSMAFTQTHADEKTVNQLLKNYTTQGANSPDMLQGKQLWQKTFNAKGEFPERSCASCHTTDLSAYGKHVKTGKRIEAMSPLSNSERLTQTKKVEKWFKRNCKWTMGRECSPQEKSDLLDYMNNSVKF